MTQRRTEGDALEACTSVATDVCAPFIWADFRQICTRWWWETLRSTDQKGRKWRWMGVHCATKRFFPGKRSGHIRHRCRLHRHMCRTCRWPYYREIDATKLFTRRLFLIINCHDKTPSYNYKRKNSIKPNAINGQPQKIKKYVSENKTPFLFVLTVFSLKTTTTTTTIHQSINQSTYNVDRITCRTLF